MNKVINENCVVLDGTVDTREDALRELSTMAEKLQFSDDSDLVYQAFLDRESQSCTGLTDGFAIPHAKANCIKTPGVVVFKNEFPIEWPSFDDQPVDILIALFVPESKAGTTHLKLLSQVAVLLMDDSFKEKIRSTDSKSEIVDFINDRITI